jgi:HEAT repeat protein
MRYLAITGVILGFFVGGAAQAQKKDKEKDQDYIAQIGGKTLEEWIEEINHRDPGRRAAAISTVLLFGPDRAYAALPAILTQLNKHTFATPLDVSVRVNAATAIGLILGSAKEPEIKHQREAVKLLKRLTKDSQAIVKFRAVQALGRVGEEAKDAIIDIVPLLNDTFACEVRQAAAITLGQIAQDKVKGPDVKVLEHLWSKCLRDPAAQVRLAAIQSLTWLGAPADAKAKDQLVRALQPVAFKDTEPTVQLWAHMAIMSITHTVSTDNVQPVIKFMEHAEVPVRVQAAQAIGTIGPKAKSGIPSLIRGLTDKDPTVIMVCVWALGRMEDNATMAVAPLEKIVKAADMPEPIQEAAKEAISQIKGLKKKTK